MRKRFIGILVFGLIMALSLPALVFANNSKSPKGIIKGRAYHDWNGNGVHDQNEGSFDLGGLIINLTRPNGSILTTITAGNFGEYNFSGLKPGTYELSAPRSFIWRDIFGMGSTSPNPVKLILVPGKDGMVKVIDFGYSSSVRVPGPCPPVKCFLPL